MKFSVTFYSYKKGIKLWPLQIFFYSLQCNLLKVMDWGQPTCSSTSMIIFSADWQRLMQHYSEDFLVKYLSFYIHESTVGLHLTTFMCIFITSLCYWIYSESQCLTVKKNNTLVKGKGKFQLLECIVTFICSIYISCF